VTTERNYLTQPIKYVYRLIDERCGNKVDLPLLSVSQIRGVVPRSDLTDKDHRADSLSLYKVCLAGDIVINRMSAYQGALGISPGRGIVSPDYLVLRPDPSTDAQYLTYLIKSDWFVGQMSARVRGIGSLDLGNVRTPRINPDDLGSIEVALPGLPEQQEIAESLRVETARIDRLIALRQRQGSLIEERWLAHLDAEIVGLELPHKTIKASRILSVTPGWSFPSEDFSTDASDVRLLRGINVGVGRLRWEESVYWPSNRLGSVSRFLLRENDVVMGMDRPWIGDGLRIAQVKGEDLPALLLQRVALVRPHAGVDRDFIYWCYQASSFRLEVEGQLTGTSVPHLSGEQIMAHRLPLLPLKEQRKMARRLRAAADNVVATRLALRRSVALLHERRQSLITSAVTDRLDGATAGGL
jgi:type I restriction enzyme S subunit